MIFPWYSYAPIITSIIRYHYNCPTYSQYCCSMGTIIEPTAATWPVGSHGHLDGMGQRRPIQVAVQTYLQFLNRDGMWLTQTNPRTTMPFFNENHFRIWIRHMNGWRWLLIYLSAPLVQSETAVNFLSIPFFCLYCRILRGFFWFYSFLQGGDEGIFLPLHTKPSCQVSRMKWSFCTTDAFHIKIW